MKKIFILGLLLFQLLYSAVAQKVEPPFWWVGMEDNELQLLVYAEGATRLKVKIDYPGVEVKKLHKFDNPNYLAVDLIISSKTKVGSFNIDFFNSTKRVYQNNTFANTKAPLKLKTVTDFHFVMLLDMVANYVRNEHSYYIEL